MSVIKTGQKAPEIILRDQHNAEFRLSAFKGRKVLLSFHPLAWTKVCARQMQSLEKNLKTFDLLNTVPIGLSVDTVPSKHAWARTLKIKSSANTGRFLAARQGSQGLRHLPGEGGLL